MIIDEDFPPSDPAGTDSVSVAIATHQRPLKLTSTLYSIIHQTHPPDEIIVVNTEDELTERVIQFFQKVSDIEIKQYLQEPKGLSHGRNIGVENATGDIVVFTDDDVVAPKNWMAAIRWVFEEYHGVVTAGGMLHPHPNVAENFAAKVDAERIMRNQYEEDFTVGGEELRTFGGANVAYRRSPIIENNILRDEYRGRENDRQYQLEVLDVTGGKNAYIPVSVWHTRDYTLRGMISQRFKNGRSAAGTPGGRTIFGSVAGLAIAPLLFVKELAVTRDLEVGLGMWLNEIIVRSGFVYETVT